MVCTSDFLLVATVHNNNYLCNDDLYVSYAIVATKLKKDSAEVLELGMKTGEAKTSPASLLLMALTCLYSSCDYKYMLYDI